MDGRKVYESKYHAMYRGGKRESGSAAGFTTFRITLFTFLICLGCILRFTDGGIFASAKDTVSDLINTDSRYVDAVEVLGKSITGNNDSGESAVEVFGRVFGITEDKGDDGGDTYVFNQVADSGAPPTQQSVELPQGYEELDPFERMEADHQMSYAAESVLPEFTVSEQYLSAIDAEEVDDTGAEPFSIATPEIVDDTVYTLSFEYDYPAKAAVTSQFGYRVSSSTGETTFHHGIDLGTPMGTRISAFADGIVSSIGYSSIYGNFVKIEHADGFLSMYAHLDVISVKEGKSVKLGDKIGESGNTGYSTGPHLHFEMRYDGKILDPNNYLSFD